MTSRLNIVTGDVWRKQAHDEPPAIVDRLLPSKALAFIAGEPGVGKSWLLWDLAISVATGKPFVDHYGITTSGGVLVIASEGSRKASEGRAWAIAQGKGLDPDAVLASLHFNWCEGFSLTNPMHVMQVAEYVRSNGITLVLVDTLHGAWGGEENNSGAWHQVMKEGVRPLTSAGATVALVHHTAKTSESTSGRRAGQTMRGSSAMHGSRDCMLVLTKDRDDESRVRVQVELRDDAPVAPFTFATPDRRISVGDTFGLDWRAAADESTKPTGDRRAAALRLVGDQPGKLTRDGLAKAVGGRKEYTSAMIVDLISEGLIEPRSPGPRLWLVNRGNVDGNATGTSGNATGNPSGGSVPALQGSGNALAPTFSDEVW